MKTAKADLTSSLRGRLSCALMNKCFVWVLVLGLMTAGNLGLSRPAAAAPNAPVISGSTATFTGDQHLGITNTPLTGLTPDFSTPPITTIAIQSLTTDITPSSPYLAGVYMKHTGAKGKNDGDSVWQADNGGAGSAGLGLTATYNGVGHTIEGRLFSLRHLLCQFRWQRR